MDGHIHCNQPQATNTNTGSMYSSAAQATANSELQQQGAGAGEEETGFMIGGHGMAGCSQYGFSVIDSTADQLRVLYYEEFTNISSPINSTEKYDAILNCVKVHGAWCALSVPWILPSDPKPCHDDLTLDNGMVRVFRQRFTLDDVIEFHAFAPLEVLPCV
jgi:hypothetical protein